MRCGTSTTAEANGGGGEGCVRLVCQQMSGDHRFQKRKGKEKDLDSRANRVQREEGGTVGGTRVTVTAAAFEQRGALGSRRTKKTRTKTFL